MIRPLTAIGIGIPAGLVLGAGLAAAVSIRESSPRAGITFGSTRVGDDVEYAKTGKRIGSFSSLEDARAAVERIGDGGSYVFIQRGQSILNRESNWAFRIDPADGARLLSGQMTTIGSVLESGTQVVAVQHGDEYLKVTQDVSRTPREGRIIENEW